MTYANRSAELPLSVKIKVPYQKRPFEEDTNEWDEYDETWDHHMELMEDVFRATFRRWRDVELHLGMQDLGMLDNVADSSDLEREGPLELLESVTLGYCLGREALPFVFKTEHAPLIYDVDFVQRLLY
ncbi:hypothetical protein CPB85DRAFT_1440138 [Mucidula mucida]|nr:hypothetical protein CPB85DRAFT_1440138 [Mucidula mucida]